MGRFLFLFIFDYDSTVSNVKPVFCTDAIRSTPWLL